MLIWDVHMFTPHPLYKELEGVQHFPMEGPLDLLYDRTCHKIGVGATRAISLQPDVCRNCPFKVPFDGTDQKAVLIGTPPSSSCYLSGSATLHYIICLLFTAVRRTMSSVYVRVCEIAMAHAQTY